MTWSQRKKLQQILCCRTTGEPAWERVCLNAQWEQPQPQPSVNHETWIHRKPNFLSFYSQGTINQLVIRIFRTGFNTALKLLEKWSINSGTFPTSGKSFVQKQCWDKWEFCVWKKIVSLWVELMLLGLGLFHLEIPGREGVASGSFLSFSLFC